MGLLRRLPRLLLNIVTVVSLLFCAAALWSKLDGSIGWGLTSDGCRIEVRRTALEIFVRGTDFSVPLEWLVLVVVTILAARLEMHRRARSERRRLSPTLCPACGYDLRATPDRCPECGAVPAPPA